MKSFAASMSAIAALGLAAIASGDGGEGAMPPLDGATAWLNSAPLSAKSLRGKVVLVNFWTYSCINSLRELPYLNAWAAKYKEAGLIVIGVHTPEFGFEKELGNVKEAISDLRVTFPVAVDSDRAIWAAFANQYWPASYFIDGKGRIRYHYFGEGAYEQSERVIQQLLRESGAQEVDGGAVRDSATGVEAPPGGDVRSPETYAGYLRTENFASPQRLAHDSPRTYEPPNSLALNQWGLNGLWSAGSEHDSLQAASGRVVFRFHARDLHMVLGPGKNGRPVRFKVTLNGSAPREDHGSDCGRDGAGEIRQPRLYQLVRQQGRIEDATFEIEFLDPGIEIFSFTFG